jgi:anti-anti-sigma factor
MYSEDIRIANQLAEIGRVVDLVDEFSRRHALPERVRQDMSIAIDEILSNVIHHSYGDDAEHRILVTLSLLQDQLQAEIVDDGAAFDPLAHKAPKPSGSVRERQLGGLGLHLVTSLMDDIRYARREGSNRLTLVKKTAGPPAPELRVGARRFSETTCAREIRERLSDVIEKGAVRMLIDLHQVEYISSAGFWSLLVAGRNIKARNGSLVLCGMREDVRRLFDLSGFAEMFRICPTRELGIEAARGAAS